METKSLIEHRFENLDSDDFQKLLGLDQESGGNYLDPEKIEKLRNIFLRLLLKNKPEMFQRIKSEEKYKNLSEEDFELEYQKRLEIQKDSINRWINYIKNDFDDINSRFDSKFILMVFQALSKMRPQGENQEMGKIKFGKRNKGSWARFPRFNAGSLAKSFDEYNQSKNSKKNYTPDDFKKDYTKFINISDLATAKEVGELPIKYEWKVFEHSEDEKNLKSIEYLQELSLETPGNWCTEGKSTAEDYTKDSGKMYVLVAKVGSKNKEVAFAAIRIKNNKISEVRGRNSGQNMPLSAGKVVGEKLRELQDSGVTGTEKEIQKVEGLKITMDLAEKILKQKDNFNPLSLSDENFKIFTKIKPLLRGFGQEGEEDEELEKSIKIILASQEKFLNSKNKKFNPNIFNQIRQKALKYIKKDNYFFKNLENKNSLKAKNMAYSEEDITENTKIFMGNLDYSKVPKEKQKNLKNLEIITGNADFKNAKNLDLSSLKYIGLDMNFEETQNIDLSSLKKIGGDGNFWNSKNINLNSLKKIIGYGNFIDTKNIKLVHLEEVGGDLSFANVKNLDLSSLKKIGKSAYFMNTQNIDLSSLKEIGRSLNFRDAQNIDLNSFDIIMEESNFSKARNINLNSLKKGKGIHNFKNSKGLIFSKSFEKKYPEYCVKSEGEKNKVLNSLKYTKLLGEISAYIGSISLDVNFEEKLKIFENLKNNIQEVQKNIFENVEDLTVKVSEKTRNVTDGGLNIMELAFENILENFHKEFEGLKNQ